MCHVTQSREALAKSTPREAPMAAVGSCSMHPALLLNLDDDVLLTLAFVIGEDRLPAFRHGKLLQWEAPIVGATANLHALSSSCSGLHALLQPQLANLRWRLIDDIKQTLGKKAVPMSDNLSDENLLLWRSALLTGGGALTTAAATTWRLDSARARRELLNQGHGDGAVAAANAALATEREIAQDFAPANGSARTAAPLRMRVTPRRLRHALPSNCVRFAPSPAAEARRATATVWPAVRGAVSRNVPAHQHARDAEENR